MKLILAALAIAVLFSATLPGENWPAWRGPLGTSVSSDNGVPTEWSDDSNIAWKTKLRGLGVSSPISWGNRVFVTYQVGRGTLRPGRHPSLVQGGDPVSEGEVPPSSVGDVAVLPACCEPCCQVSRAAATAARVASAS